MQTHTKLLLATIATTILLAITISNASARRIETSERGFLVRWSPLIFSFGGNRFSCPVTLEGSFHSRTLSKVCGQLIGYVATAQVGNGEPPCQGATLTALTETLPWHIQYRSFTGTLPTITSIKILMVGMRLAFTTGGVECLFGTTQAHPAAGNINVTSGSANTLTALPEFTIPLGGEFICGLAGNGSFAGTGEVFTLVTPQTRITVRLVQ